jgi:hypothetical protein
MAVDLMGSNTRIGMDSCVNTGKIIDGIPKTENVRDLLLSALSFQLVWP